MALLADAVIAALAAQGMCSRDPHQLGSTPVKSALGISQVSPLQHAGYFYPHATMCAQQGKLAAFMSCPALSLGALVFPLMHLRLASS